LVSPTIDRVIDFAASCGPSDAGGTICRLFNSALFSTRQTYEGIAGMQFCRIVIVAIDIMW
jgi:hypothetical protein